MYLPYLKITNHDVGKLLSLEHDDESLYKIVVIEKNSNKRKRKNENGNERKRTFSHLFGNM